MGLRGDVGQVVRGAMRTDDICETVHRLEDQVTDLYVRLDSLQSGLSEEIWRSSGIVQRQLHDQGVQQRRFEDNAMNYLYSLFRREGESKHEADLRIFRSVPSPAGARGVYQRALVALLAEFDRICGELGLRYWLICGALLGTMARGSLIPWDDDVDVAMPRRDVEKLMQELRGNNSYRITVVYDAYARCKQVRFSPIDEELPCFIDIDAWDWTNDASDITRDRVFDERRKYDERLAAYVEGDGYWKSHQFAYSADSIGETIQFVPFDQSQEDPQAASNVCAHVEKLLRESTQKLRDLDVLADSEADARGITKSFEPMMSRHDSYVVKKETIFPLRRVDLGEIKANVPCDALGMLDVIYPGWPWLADNPDGGHFPAEILNDAHVVRALSVFANEILGNE